MTVKARFCTQKICDTRMRQQLAGYYYDRQAAGMRVLSTCLREAPHKPSRTMNYSAVPDD